MHKDFQKFMAEKWGTSEVQGWGAFVVKEKLKLLKTEIKEWNVHTFGNMEENISKSIEGIRLVDVKGEGEDLSESDLLSRREHMESFWKYSRMKDAFNFQCSRSK